MKLAIKAADNLQKSLDNCTCSICQKEFDADVTFRQRAYISHCSHQFCYGCLAEEAGGHCGPAPACNICGNPFFLADIRIVTERF